jgi:hypothetical protein
LGFGAESFPVLFRYYLQEATERPSLAKSLGGWARAEEAKGTLSARFSAKLNEVAFARLATLEQTYDLKRTEVVKGIIMKAKRDLLDDDKPDLRRKLEGLLSLAGG